jgi:hypothetical protein
LIEPSAVSNESTDAFCAVLTDSTKPILVFNDPVAAALVDSSVETLVTNEVTELLTEVPLLIVVEATVSNELTELCKSVTVAPVATPANTVSIELTEASTGEIAIVLNELLAATKSEICFTLICAILKC